MEFKFQRHSCQLSFLFPPHRQSTPESLLAGCSEQGWETNLRIQTLAIFMLVRGECWGSHTAPPLSFLPHFLLMYFSHWTMIYRRPPAPSSSFTSLLQRLSILLWQLNLSASLSPPSTCIWIFFNPPIFLCGFKNFKMNLPVHTNPTRICIHSSTQNSSGNIGNRACIVKCAKFASRIMAESTQKLTKNAKIKVDSSAGKRENLGMRLPSWIQYSR